MDRILKIFLDSEGRYVSGEEIANMFGLSRMGVWKAIQRLKERGFVFESVTKKGYRLLTIPKGVIIPEAIEKTLEETEQLIKIFVTSVKTADKKNKS